VSIVLIKRFRTSKNLAKKNNQYKGQNKNKENRSLDNGSDQKQAVNHTAAKTDKLLNILLLNFHMLT